MSTGGANDVVAVEQLVRRSAALNDGRAWPALAALYTGDGLLRRPNGEQVAGREAIEASYAAGSATRRTRHVCGGTLVDVDGDTARAVTPVLLFTWDASENAAVAEANGPAIGEFADALVRTGDGWRIAERIATVTARVPTGAG